MTRGGAIRFAGWVAALALLALPVVGVLEGWLVAGRWPVRYLTLEAPFVHVHAAQVRAVAAPLLARGFFAIDLNQVQRAVAALPWVASAQVRKRWPDTVTIRIAERAPWARWTGGRLIATDGTVFSVPDAATLGGLPQLAGPDARLADVIAFYRVAAAACAAHGLHVAAVDLTGRGSYALTLAGGARISVGHEQPTRRLARFLAVWPQLASAHPQGFEYADLRYTNGFAVKWPPEPPSAAPAAPAASAAPAAAPSAARV